MCQIERNHYLISANYEKAGIFDFKSSKKKAMVRLKAGDSLLGREGGKGAGIENEHGYRQTVGFIAPVL
ncbi:hypothetical protein [Larkinella arboricola]|uniref:hypothetical protein n=1 Tax=Larkinella arboricola TaxID=643671 RepID=UPI0014752EE1|nr:hypothetical protein [Larkinella arboricola]